MSFGSLIGLRVRSTWAGWTLAPTRSRPIAASSTTGCQSRRALPTSTASIVGASTPGRFHPRVGLRVHPWLYGSAARVTRRESRLAERSATIEAVTARWEVYVTRTVLIAVLAASLSVLSGCGGTAETAATGTSTVASDGTRSAAGGSGSEAAAGGSVAT